MSLTVHTGDAVADGNFVLLWIKACSFQEPKLNVCVCTTSEVYSCSADGMVLVWNVRTLRVTSRLQLPSGRLSSLRLHSGHLWCCKSSALRHQSGNLTPALL